MSGVDLFDDDGFIGEFDISTIELFEEEETFWERQLNLREQHTRIEALKQNIEQRGKYARLFYRMSAAWLIYVGLAVALDALNVSCFQLEKEVAIALLASGIANVFAPVVVTAKGIFNYTVT